MLSLDPSSIERLTWIPQLNNFVISDLLGYSPKAIHVFGKTQAHEGPLNADFSLESVEKNTTKRNNQEILIKYGQELLKNLIPITQLPNPSSDNG